MTFTPQVQLEQYTGQSALDSTLSTILAFFLLCAYLLVSWRGPQPIANTIYYLIFRLWNGFVDMLPLRLPTKAFGLDTKDLLKGLRPDSSLRALGVLRGHARPTTLPGLGNWDNSCYQNSVIQGLASLPQFNAFLRQLEHTTEAISEETTVGALRETLLRLNDQSRRGQVLWTPSKLKSMSSWQQQDAQEYFSKIIELMEKDILRVWKQPVQAKGLDAINILGEDHTDEHLAKTIDGIACEPDITREDRPAANSKSAFTEVSAARPEDPLEGFLGQRVACMTCGFTEGLSLIPFNCLTVPLGSRYNYDLQKCLDEYTKLETIDDVECAKCTLLRTQQTLNQLLLRASAGNKENGSPNPLQESARSRLGAVEAALEEEDFSDNTITKRCQISKKNRVCSAKSRQAVIAKSPRNLVVHVNRSVFDEFTSAQRKNYAQVSFPKDLDLSFWCLGRSTPDKSEIDVDGEESWSLDPRQSLLAGQVSESVSANMEYELRAVVTHYGRHENGHYICYRKHSLHTEDDGGEPEDSPLKEPAEEGWWRLSDEDVSPVSEDNVLQQGGVFMLFYERKSAKFPALHSVGENEAAEVPAPDEVELTEVLKEDTNEDRACPTPPTFDAGKVPSLDPESAEPAIASNPTLETLDANTTRYQHSQDTSSLDEQTFDYESTTATSVSEDEVDPSTQLASDSIASPQHVPPLQRPTHMRTSRFSGVEQKDGSFSSSRPPMVAAT